MTYVVTEQCVNCKYSDCVEVCPVDCFHQGPNMLVINPEECIDCALCVPECPVEAIYYDEDVPDGQQEYFAINEKYSKVWPVILQKIDPPPDADSWANKPDKTKLIQE